MNNGNRFRRSIHVRHGRPKTKRFTEFLVDDYSPLVQPTIHAVVEGQLKLGRLQEGIDLSQHTQEVVSAVKRSATKERARPPRNSTRAHEIQSAAPQRTTFHQLIVQELRKTMR